MSGEHVYVEASNACNDLVFTLGPTAQGVTEIATRSFSIKISQYACDFTNLAPAGCDQYFYGSDSGYVQSFNYQNTKHLAAQSQDICFRREKNMCSICFSADSASDVKISGM